MPPKRRAASTRSASARSNQSTLTFHGRDSRVTKPHTPAAGAKASKEDTVSSAQKPAQQSPEAVEIPSPGAEKPDVDDDEAAEGTSAVAVTPVPTVTKKARETPAERDEAAAKALPETRIKAYWREKEAARKAPRVHQEGLSVHEKILREWDTSGRFGPNVGIPRLRRWHRAQALGLDPPVEVLAVLVREREQADAKKAKDGARYDRAYMDELLNGRDMAE